MTIEQSSAALHQQYHSRHIEMQVVVAKVPTSYYIYPKMFMVHIIKLIRCFKSRYTFVYISKEYGSVLVEHMSPKADLTQLRVDIV